VCAQGGSSDTFAAQQRALEDLLRELMFAAALTTPLSLMMWAGGLSTPLPCSSCYRLHGPWLKPCNLFLGVDLFMTEIVPGLHWMDFFAVLLSTPVQIFAGRRFYEVRFMTCIIHLACLRMLETTSGAVLPPYM
jgi:hypothetical protein